MFAVVDILGQQVKVTENSTYYVPKLPEELNKTITFKNVILFSDENGTKIGSPFVDGINVKAKVLEHTKDNKVLVYKKKRRISYEKKNGHRQAITKIEITKIG